MNRTRYREIATDIALLIGLLATIAITIKPPTAISQLDSSASATMLTSVSTIVATLGGLLSAVHFLTAQTRPAGIRGQALAVLYKDRLTPSFISIIVSTLACSVLASVTTLPPEVLSRLTAVAVLGCLLTLLLVVPVTLVQIENLSPRLVAAKLLRGFNAATVRSYGLVDINVDEYGAKTVVLKTNGLNYERRDPLRPLHELIENAIQEKDRLLLGQLLGALCERVANELGVTWPEEGSATSDWSPRLRWFKKRANRSDPGQDALAIHALHYILRLTNNLHREWPGMDVGRHGAQYQIVKLIAALTKSSNTQLPIMVATSALIRISLQYRDVTPFGRVEPLNAIHKPCNLLRGSGRRKELDYLLLAIAYIQEETEQLSGERGAPVKDMLWASANEDIDKYRKRLSTNEIQSLVGGADPWYEFAPITPGS